MGLQKGAAPCFQPFWDWVVREAFQVLWFSARAWKFTVILAGEGVLQWYCVAKDQETGRQLASLLCRLSILQAFQLLASTAELHLKLYLLWSLSACLCAVFMSERCRVHAEKNSANCSFCSLDFILFSKWPKKKKGGGGGAGRRQQQNTLRLKGPYACSLVAGLGFWGFLSFVKLKWRLWYLLKGFYFLIFLPVSSMAFHKRIS